MTMLTIPTFPAATDTEKTATIAPVSPFAFPKTEFKQMDIGLSVDAKPYKLTIVHFWATWCVPCVKELPELDEISGKYKDKGLQVVPLSLDGNMQTMRKFYIERGIKHLMPNLDSRNTIFSEVNGKGLPYSLFLGPDGKVFAHAEGPVDWKAKDTVEFIEKRLK